MEFKSVCVLIVLCCNVVCDIPNRISLDSNSGGFWTAINSNRTIKIVANVPGGIYSDLQSSGIIHNILWGYNDVNTRWVSKDTWTYTVTFEVGENHKKKEVAKLVFEGLDTFATIKLNDRKIGRSDNMFTKYVHPIKEHLMEGTNTLEVTFLPSAQLAKERSDRYYVAPACGPTLYHGECHINQIRKMQASYAWDWGPAFPSVGIWKPVYVEFYDKSPIIKSILTNITKTHPWKVEVKTILETANGKRGRIKGSIEAMMTTNLGILVTNVVHIDTESNLDGAAECTAQLFFTTNEISLWWPNGYGAQPLYTLTVIFTDERKLKTEKSIKIGFRTIELVEEDAKLHLSDDQPGSKGLTFYFKVNGIALFMKGSNWIPAHILPEKGSDENVVDDLLESAAYAGMSMLRVWGGGVYESDYFYNRCDELGILVWQDLMFACAMYPADESFLSSVKKEVEHNVRRLQHHVSIAVWAGNNENEAALRGNWYGTGNDFNRYKKEYISLYVDTIRPIVKLYDPTRRYLVSSPSNGIESEQEDYIAINPYDSHYGDTHYYNYIADGLNMNIYPKTRFASEYGFQSFPSLETWHQATNSSKDLNLASDFMNHRQHSPGGTVYIKGLIERHFSIDENDSNYFSEFIFLSQLTQALAIKAETEFYRQSRNDWMTMGALYWQLNDVWQAPSWSGIDVDHLASVHWLRFGNLFGETEGIICAIQDEVMMTKNFRRYVIKDGTVGICRACHQPEYGGKWKMLHYMAKKFFAPVLVSPRVTSANDLEVYLINDRFIHLDFDIVLTSYSWDSFQPVKEINIPGMVRAMSVAKLEQTWKIDKRYFYKFSVKVGGEPVSPDNFVFPEIFKKLAIKEPKIKLVVTASNATTSSVRTFNIGVIVDRIVPFLYLEAKGVSGHFSDNVLTATSRYNRLQFYTTMSVTAEELSEALQWHSYFTPAGHQHLDVRVDVT